MGEPVCETLLLGCSNRTLPSIEVKEFPAFLCSTCCECLICQIINFPTGYCDLIGDSHYNKYISKLEHATSYTLLTPVLEENVVLAHQTHFSVKIFTMNRTINTKSRSIRTPKRIHSALPIMISRGKQNVREKLKDEPETIEVIGSKTMSEGGAF